MIPVFVLLLLPLLPRTSSFLPPSVQPRFSPATSHVADMLASPFSSPLSAPSPFSSPLSASLPGSPPPPASPEPSWDSRELLPYAVRLASPPSPSLGVHHLPPDVGRGDLVTVAGRAYKVRRVRFLLALEAGSPPRYRVRKKVLEVTTVRREVLEGRLERAVGGGGEG